MSVQDYSPLVERVRKRITSWTTRQLSFAGRLQLIGSVIHSLTNFWMSVFRLPKQCLKEIDQLCSAFLWSGPDLNPKKAKIAWSEVCKPRTEGGLGLRPLEETNKVCVLKLIWRILSAKSLWVEWIHHYLIRKGSFWNVNSKSSLGSWLWKKILKYRATAQSLTRIEVNNGAQTSFWFDVWSPLGRIFDLTGSRGCIDLGLNINITVESAIIQYRRRRHRSALLINIEKEILTLRNQGLKQADDIRLWKGSGDSFNRDFSTSQTWQILRAPDLAVNWSQAVWFPAATPKFSMIVWLAVRDRLATGERMLKWNPQGDATCVLCQAQVETRNHLFFGCVYSETIWKALTQKLIGSRYTNIWNQLLELLLNTNQDNTKLFLIRYTFQAVLYSVWRERNCRRHGEAPHPPTHLVKYIDKLVRNRIDSLRGCAKYNKAMGVWFASR